MPAGMTIEDLRRVSEQSQNETEVHGVRSYMNLSEGKAVCIIEAASKEKVEEFFRKNNLPYDDIVAIEVEGEHGVWTDLRVTEALAV
jgi:hydrogenase maturation factor